LVKDLDDVAPRIVYPHEMLAGIEGSLPPLKGLVLTTVKDNPLVEWPFVLPFRPRRRNSTVWPLGRTVWDAPPS